MYYVNINGGIDGLCEIWRILLIKILSEWKKNCSFIMIQTLGQLFLKEFAC